MHLLLRLVVPAYPYLHLNFSAHQLGKQAVTRFYKECYLLRKFSNSSVHVAHYDIKLFNQIAHRNSELLCQKLIFGYRCKYCPVSNDIVFKKVFF